MFDNVNVWEWIRPHVKTEKFESQKHGDQDECTICLNKFKDSDELACLNCDDRHYFHYLCAQQWLQTHTTCPLCRKECIGDKKAQSQIIGLRNDQFDLENNLGYDNNEEYDIEEQDEENNTESRPSVV